MKYWILFFAFTWLVSCSDKNETSQQGQNDVPEENVAHDQLIKEVITICYDSKRDVPSSPFFNIASPINSIGELDPVSGDVVQKGEVKKREYQFTELERIIIKGEGVSMKVRSLYVLDKLQGELTRLSLVRMNMAPTSSGFPERAVSGRIEYLQKKLKEVRNMVEEYH